MVHLVLYSHETSRRRIQDQAVCLCRHKRVSDISIANVSLTTMRQKTTQHAISRQKKIKTVLNKQQQRRLLFLAAKGSIRPKSTCTRKHIKEIHTDTSSTANVFDN